MNKNMETKNCQNCKKDFIIEPEDFNFYQKMKVPPPTFCPLCRAQRRFAFRNERKFFRVKDAFTGKDRPAGENFTFRRVGTLLLTAGFLLQLIAFVR